MQYHYSQKNERLDKEQILAKSYGFLKEVLEQQYRSALSAVVSPIQEEVKRLLDSRAIWLISKM